MLTIKLTLKQDVFSLLLKSCPQLLRTKNVYIQNGVKIISSITMQSWIVMHRKYAHNLTKCFSSKSLISLTKALTLFHFPWELKLSHSKLQHFVHKFLAKLLAKISTSSVRYFKITYSNSRTNINLLLFQKLLFILLNVIMTFLL